MSPKELRQLVYSLVHIFRHPIGLDVPCAGDKIQFLVVCARGFAEALFGHIERVGIAARHHQERLVDEVHLEKPRDFDPFGQTGFAHLWLQYD